VYIPKHFQIEDRQQLIHFIKNNSFGILFSQTEEGPYATHLPFFLKEQEGEQGILTGHMARANPHWKGQQEEVLVVFSGPHAYISPTWYEEPNTVPTWNYAAVHVYGKLSLVEEKEELLGLLEEMADFYEADMEKPWQVQSDNQYIQNMLNAIVGFRIEITRIEGKFKLNQNHPIERQERVIRQLQTSTDAKANAIADLMQSNVDKAKANQ
jgi:transcriptional regulator